MKIDTTLYPAGSTIPAASDTIKIAKSTAKYVIYTSKSCVHLFSKLYDNQIFSLNFKRNYDYLVQVTYNKDEAVTVLDKIGGDVTVLYDAKSPKDKGVCVIYRCYNSPKLTVTISDGYGRVITFTADTVSFDVGGAE